MRALYDGKTGELLAAVAESGQQDLSLEGIRLYKGDLSRLELHRANFDFGTLENVSFLGSDLMGSRFREARMTRICFEAANLTATDFFEATLLFVNFHRANLRRSVFRYARLIDVNLSNADLTGANLSMARISGNCHGADFSGADLRGADLREANIGETNFSGAKLENAKLIGGSATLAQIRLAALSKKTQQSPFLPSRPNDQHWWRFWS